MSDCGEKVVIGDTNEGKREKRVSQVAKFRQCAKRHDGWPGVTRNYRKPLGAFDWLTRLNVAKNG